MESSIRDLNRSLYRGIHGEPDRGPRSYAGSSGEVASCFNAESGLLYATLTGRCAPGYAMIPADAAMEQRNRPLAAGTPPSGNAPSRPAPQTASAPLPSAGEAAPFDRTALALPGQALCFDPARQELFGADTCPPGSRWTDSAEAEAIQRAALEQSQWCYFSSRRVLYRARGCRPGDQAVQLAEADRLWTQLPADRRPRQRPSESRGSGLAPVPPAQAAPRPGVNATPLPAPR